MRLDLAAGAALLLFPMPALATGGFDCRPASGAGPRLTMGISHSLQAIPFSVTLEEGGRTLSTQGDRPALVIGQSWFDSRYLWLDLVDPTLSRREATLRTVFQPRLKGRPAIGTLVRGGRTYRMRCVEG